MENLKCVLIDSDEARRREVSEAISMAGHIVIKEVATADEYRKTMRQFVADELDADFFLCDRNVVGIRQSRKMWAVGARAIRFGLRTNPLDPSILPENRTIYDVLDEFDELEEL